MTPTEVLYLYLRAVPDNQRRNALLAVWPEGAALLHELPDNPQALEKCSYDELLLLDAAVGDDVPASEIINSDPRWDEQHNTFLSNLAQNEMSCGETLNGSVDSALNILLNEPEPEELWWWRNANAQLARIEDTGTRSAVAAELCEYLEEAPDHLVVCQEAVKALLTALAGPLDVIDDLADVNPGMLHITVALCDLPEPAVLASLLELLYERDALHHVWSPIALRFCDDPYFTTQNETVTPLLDRIAAASSEWKTAALALPTEAYGPRWNIVTALITGKVTKTVAQRCGDSLAWELAIRCPARSQAQLRLAVAALQRRHPTIVIGDAGLGTPYAQIARTVLDSTLPTTAKGTLAARLVNAAIDTGRGMDGELASELLSCAAEAVPDELPEMCLAADRVELLAHLVNMAPLVMQDGTVARAAGSYLAAAFENADATAWQLAWGMLPEWKNSIASLAEAAIIISTPPT